MWVSDLETTQSESAIPVERKLSTQETPHRWGEYSSQSRTGLRFSVRLAWARTKVRWKCGLVWEVRPWGDSSLPVRCELRNRRVCARTFSSRAR